MVLKQAAVRNRANKLESKGLLKLNRSDPSRLSTLDVLLHDMYSVACPKPSDYQSRRDLIRAFTDIAKEVYGGCDDFPVVEAFGSFSMDMFSNKSDLDLSVNFSKESVELSREDKIKALRKFSKKLYRLQSKGRMHGVNPILSAKVPVLKVVDRGTGIECDISIENKDGIVKSQFIFIVSAIDERFQKLCSLMKAMAKAYGINSSKDGTLNSLSITLLVAFHLQTREPPILPPFSALLKDGTNPGSVKKVVQDYLKYGKENKESLADLFATLLAKLSSVEMLWSEGLCVSTYEGSWISKTWKSKVGSISVEDFVDRSQNVARAVGAKSVKVVYKCINSSLHHLSAFTEGRIEAPKLKVLLFGAEPVPLPDENMLNLKRNFPFHNASSPTSLDPVITKKSRPAAGWDSCRGHQTYGANQSYSPPITTPVTPGKASFVVPGVGNGFQQGSTRFREIHGPQQIPFPCPKYTKSQRLLGSNKAWDPAPPIPNVPQQLPFPCPKYPEPQRPLGSNRAWDPAPPTPNGGERGNSWATHWDSPSPTPNGGGQWNSWPTCRDPPSPKPNGGGQLNSWSNYHQYSRQILPLHPHGGGQRNSWPTFRDPPSRIPNGGEQGNLRSDCHQYPRQNLPLHPHEHVWSSAWPSSHKRS